MAADRVVLGVSGEAAMGGSALARPVHFRLGSIT